MIDYTLFNTDRSLMRTTTERVPNNFQLLKESQIPYGVIVKPLGDMPDVSFTLIICWFVYLGRGCANCIIRKRPYRKVQGVQSLYQSFCEMDRKWSQMGLPILWRCQQYWKVLLLNHWGRWLSNWPWQPPRIQLWNCWLLGQSRIHESSTNATHFLVCIWRQQVSCRQWVSSSCLFYYQKCDWEPTACRNEWWKNKSCFLDLWQKHTVLQPQVNLEAASDDGGDWNWIGFLAIARRFLGEFEWKLRPSNEPSG